jgi:uncharacterized membrane-anchored protein YhcB (DUF1043 family)
MKWQRDRAQKEFDEFNERLCNHEFPECCKGKLVLDLWDDYDDLQKLIAISMLTLPDTIDGAP